MILICISAVIDDVEPCTCACGPFVRLWRDLILLKG